MELYIHIPFCMKKCNYCDFLSGPYDRDIREQYTSQLIREMEYYAGIMQGERIESVYIGGGTPSWLELPLMQRILEGMNNFFYIGEETEVTIECNPGTVSKDGFALYRRFGINRVSIGLQSANDDELALLGRIHNYNRFLKTYEFARECGFYNINIDLMTALPGQTPEKLLNSLKEVIRLKPEHVSVYELTIEEGTPFYKRYAADDKRRKAGMPTVDLPTEDQAYELSKIAQQMLIENGFAQYEISNYAKEGFACAHNIGYWRRVPYLGVGLGAASLIGHRRYTNTRDMYKYLQNPAPHREVETELSKSDEMSEFMFLGLRMHEGISRFDFEKIFGMTVDAAFGPQINELRREALIGASAGRIYLTEKGMDLANYCMSLFV